MGESLSPTCSQYQHFSSSVDVQGRYYVAIISYFKPQGLSLAIIALLLRTREPSYRMQMAIDGGATRRSRYVTSRG